jgi:hypothetical protein
MSDDVRALNAERIQNAGDVSDDRRQSIVGNRLWLAAAPTPAHVGHDRTEAAFDESRHLVAPEIAGVGKTVQQHDRRSGTLIADVELQPVGFDQLGQPAPS